MVNCDVENHDRLRYALLEGHHYTSLKITLGTVSMEDLSKTFIAGSYQRSIRGYWMIM